MLLAMVFGLTYILRKFRLHFYLTASGCAVVMGMLGGLFIRFVLRDQQLFDLVHFDERTFFLFILPPIIFGAGLSLNSVSRLRALAFALAPVSTS
jgi:NhaP-type Na+/H+ or K+/H+ antiporter